MSKIKTFLASSEPEILQKKLELVQLSLMAIAVSFFMPHGIASGIVLVSGALFVCMKGIREKILTGKGTVAGFIFLLVTFFVSLLYVNLVGALRALVFIALLAVVAVSRSVITRDFFERLLNLMVAGGSFVALHTVAEFIINFNAPLYRCQGYYTNPNFLGTALTFVIVVCAYKVSCHVEMTWLYYAAAVLCAIGLYLCKSMSLWPVGMIAIIIVLALHREYKLLLIFLSVVVAAVLAVLFIPGILSRLNELDETIDNRVKIWSFAIENFKDKPIFGRGFHTYRFMYYKLRGTREIYEASMAHSVYLDSLLNHGVVGTGLALNALVRYFASLFSTRHKLGKLKGNTRISALVIALIFSLCLYGLIDTTFVWINTGGIVVVIASGIGIEERELKTLKKE